MEYVDRLPPLDLTVARRAGASSWFQPLAEHVSSTREGRVRYLVYSWIVLSVVVAIYTGRVMRLNHREGDGLDDIE